MGSPERYNLLWNSFETNTRTVFMKLREESEFDDVTVVADCGKQVEANKVVLAAGSMFFHKILKENPHPHPLIYLKGVGYEHLSSVLDFVYTGEADISKGDLDKFLEIAQDLKVKGLTKEAGLSSRTSHSHSPGEAGLSSRTSHPQHPGVPGLSSRTSHSHSPGEAGLSSRTSHPHHPGEPGLSSRTSHPHHPGEPGLSSRTSHPHHPGEAGLSSRASHPHRVISSVSQGQVVEEKAAPSHSIPSSSVSHSRTVLTPQNNTTFSQSTFKEGHDDNLVADHSNVPSGMNGQDEAERYDNGQVKNINFNDNIVLSGEYQNESERLSAAPKKQAIRTGKNPNNIYHSELYKLKGENNTELYKEEMVDSNCDMGDTEATVNAVKNEESTHDWYGWDRENDANVIWDEEQGRIDQAFSPGKNFFQCSFCTKTFDMTSKLNRHIRVHTGEKPFRCLVCSKIFSRQDHLRGHNRIHEKPYQCMFCSQMFSEKRALNQHMKNNKCSMKN